RRAWRTAQAHPTDETPEANEETTLVTESSWSYLTSGYRPGEELLAEQVRHELTHKRDEIQRRKSEGEPWL
ncbi:replication initiation protein, partial [Streptomyces sp. NPDC050610]